MDIPCIECFMIPLCRHKSYAKLVNDCELVNDFSMGQQERNEHDYFKYLVEIEIILKPTAWEYYKKHWGRSAYNEWIKGREANGNETNNNNDRY